MQLIGNEIISDLPDNHGPLDLLDRQSFINQLIDIAETLSENKKNSCYAITGSWGCGKSFVLDMYEDQITQIQTSETTMGKYLLFHYNCWQYDYYSEPLIAIIASILDAINDQTALLSEETREFLKVTLQKIGSSLFSAANIVIATKTGFNMGFFKSRVKAIKQEADNNLQQKHAFDPHFDFKKNIKNLRTTLNRLSKDQTVLFVVDELDRCMPEYAIKVLERLHHVFDDLPNIQVILAIDKTQLEHTICQIYGSHVDVPKYLEKYIDFELLLPTGEVSNIVKELYPAYYNAFSNDITPVSMIDDFCTTVLKGIDIRTCKAIVEKSQLCHKLLNEDTPQDAAVMCVEIFLTLLKTFGLNCTTAKNNFNVNTLFTTTSLFSKTKHQLTGLVVLGQKYKAIANGESRYFNQELSRPGIVTSDIWGLILGCYRIIIGYTNDDWYNDAYHKLSLDAYVRKFWKFIRMIH